VPSPKTLRYRIGFWMSIVAGVCVVGLLFFHLFEMREICEDEKAGFIYFVSALLVGSLFLASWAVRKMVANEIIYSKNLELRTKKMRELAITDGLTKIFNHRYFEHKLEKEWKRFERFRHALSCVMIDIDDFKKINDTFGHRAGDLVLHGIADLLRENLREVDIISRYGGEEFVVLLLEKPSHFAGLRQTMEKIRAEIAAHEFIFDGQKIRVTASFGGAMLPNSKIISADQLVHLADKAMYFSKKNGKNCVSVFDDGDCC